MGRKLDALMGKAFRSSKCKTQLKLTVARVKILRNKRELQCKQLRKDVAQLLQNGQEASARLRVEHLIREQNMLDAYVLISGYCEVLTERMISIKTQKTCPNDLNESIASLVFAAPRCADLPELQDVRYQFAAKFGREFTESAVELRAGCGVSKQIIEKLSTRVPNAEVKLKLMKEIASENGIEWNFEETKAEKFNPEDTLDVSKQHFEASQTASKPQDVSHEPIKISSMSSQAHDAVRQQVSESIYSSPPTPQLDVSMKGKEEFLSSTKQGHGESLNADIYNSNSLKNPPHFQENSVVSSDSAQNIDPNISENYLYTRQGTEGKMDHHISMKSTTANQNIPSSDHDFMKFANIAPRSAGLKQEDVKYKDVATAAQAAFESAAYAAAAARAAVQLSRCELGNKELNNIVNDSRGVMPESEDKHDEAISRERRDRKYMMPSGVGSGIESNFSTRKDDASFDVKSSRMKNWGNDVFSLGEDLKKTHQGEKEVYDSESGEEPDQASLSKDSAAAQAAVELSRCEPGNKELNNRVNDSRDVMPESEDEHDEAISRERHDREHMMRSGVGSGIESNFSTRKDNASFDIKSPRMKNWGNDVFSLGEDFKNTHQGEKEVSDSESGEEPSEDQASLSKDRSHVHKSSQEHYSDDEEEHETNAFYEEKRLDDKQMHDGMIEPKLKKLMSGGKFNSNEQPSSPKASQPLFDDYGDDDDDFEENPSGRPSRQSALAADRRSGTEDTELWHSHYTTNQRQVHDYDGDDGYEKGISRKEYKNQDFAREKSGPPKLSYGDFVPKEKYPLQYLELESEDEMETLNGDGGVKFQGRRNTLIETSQPDKDYLSSHGMPFKKRVGGTVSVDQSTYPGSYKEYDPDDGIQNQYVNTQSSDDEGVYRYEGNGKLRWHPANLVEQRVSVEGHKSHHINTRMSVRTWR